MTGIGSVSAPTHPANEFLAYEAECRSVLGPLLMRVLDMAESAGWSRRTAASTLMFLAAQHVSAASESSGGSTRDGGRDHRSPTANDGPMSGWEEDRHDRGPIA
ncbi:MULTISPECIES: hypothetical protein [unclassified Mesorhizobium]|uniref:hypothetical protein n=1 Tax=unclassified Mesorhizobium TaxID=325217 RepID=UPI001CCDD442|nr:MULTISPECIES: hypothetical protein [unclassified Mesorhizobium]MBZ9999469.1 hypothetical protein [Mesorhizobium sp. B264B2A]MCA0007943.1 hypothetical protein [Mesorhizobium sp. B264B1B]MCA0022768.1 hypothetical protein [Mesorhizobium sp. B264B1A]